MGSGQVSLSEKKEGTLHHCRLYYHINEKHSLLEFAAMIVGDRRALAVLLMVMVVRSTSFLQNSGSFIARRAVALNAARAECPRPTLGDVEWISRADAAKRRGGASRMVPQPMVMVGRSTSLLQSTRSLFTRTAVVLSAAKGDPRPTLDDVERISRGDAAKRRGTGSRAVPHRLNSLERKEWDLSKKRHYMLLRGTGYRKERGASPLANIYRQLCDALNIVCITVSRGVGNPPKDEVIIDFSPLRTTQVSEMARACMDEAAAYSSLESVEDRSNVDLLGWTDVDDMLSEDVIWRIPVFAVVATFTSRADSRRYAETLAVKYANGIPSSIRTEGEENEDDIEE
jgi:hypothetical protein